MAFNIYIEPIEETEEVVPTKQYISHIKIEVEGEGTGVEEDVLFPDCLEEMEEERVKIIIKDIVVEYLKGKVE